MKILIVGAGSIGGYFGGRLLQTGADVTFLVRGKRQKQLADHGLLIRSPSGDFVYPSPSTVRRDQLGEHFDVVVLTCKAYDLEGAIDDFAPAVGVDTWVLPLLNGMTHLDVLDSRFGADRVLGGLCLISTTLGTDGEIIHMGDLQSLTVGSRSGSAQPTLDAFVEALDAAGIDAHRSDDILQDMWNKWIFIATAAALTGLMRASVGDVVEAGGSDFARNLLSETSSIAAANGRPVDDASIERFTRMFTSVGSVMTASLLRDMQDGKAIEAEAIVGDLVRRRGSIDTPLLDTAYLHMKSYLAHRNRTA